MKKHYRVLIAYIAVALISGCAAFKSYTPPPDYYMKTEFNEKDFKDYAKSGKFSISGQVFAKTKGGDVKFGAGNDVEISPYNDYVKEYDTASVNYSVKNFEYSKVKKYIKTTKADAQGNFDFKNLPPGTYKVSSSVYWTVPRFNDLGKYSYWDTQETGGKVVKIVTITNESVKVVMQVQ